MSISVSQENADMESGTSFPVYVASFCVCWEFAEIFLVPTVFSSLFSYMLQMVFQSALPHSMTAWARRRRAASTSSLTWHPTSSQGWSSLCSVRWGWGRESCHVATLAKISSKNVLLVSDAVLILPPCWLTNSCPQMLMCPFPRCLASVQQNTQPVLGPQAYT